MNGKSDDSAGLLRPVAAAMILVGVLAGCGSSVDGRLDRNCSRLRVVNDSPWDCAVTVEPRSDQTKVQQKVDGIIPPGREVTWDLLAGKYKVYATKLEPPTRGFSEDHDAVAGKEFIWSLTKLRDK
jgi:hypothetical protein